MHTPIWELFVDGTDTPVSWVNAANPRFAIYKAGTKAFNDDVVLDKETGLIWPRNANLNGQALNWLDANTTARALKLANRIGWRLPSVEELSSLVDTRRSNPALPTDHPFISIQSAPDDWAYWTSTNFENPSAAAWFVNLNSGDAGPATKGGNPPVLGFIWPVRGGHAGVNWNW